MKIKIKGQYSNDDLPVVAQHIAAQLQAVGVDRLEHTKGAQISAKAAVTPWRLNDFDFVTAFGTDFDPNGAHQQRAP